MQKLQLEIRRISILTGRGTDQISFCVPNDQALDKVLGNTEARQLFPELSFDLKITKGKGKDLLAALGLTADEIISLEPVKYEFGKHRYD
jgi:hypothetical protein